LRQVLLDGRGGDAVGQVPDRELGAAEGMGVRGGDEGAGQRVDVVGGGRPDGIGEGLSFGEFLRGQGRCGAHGCLQDRG
jgi:hypothetical protein